MKIFTKEELQTILDNHKLWLQKKSNGVKANLSGVNLRKADLSLVKLLGVNLSQADLSQADLSGANLSQADLSGANLSGANLLDAYLSGVNLSEANLSGANLWKVDLSGANLSGANLFEANLSRANLWKVDLSGANLSGANLFEANLFEANLSDLRNKEITLARISIVPEHGSFVGWKKCQDSVIVKVQIPEISKRSNATGRKCRAEFVKVLEIFNGSYGISIHDDTTEYVKGCTVRCDIWCEDRFKECAGGIHFFLTRAEAENYR